MCNRPRYVMSWLVAFLVVVATRSAHAARPGAAATSAEKNAGRSVASACGLDYYAQGGVVVKGVAYFTANDDSRMLGARRSADFPSVAAFDTHTFLKLRTYPFAKTYDSSPLVIQNKAGRWLVLAHEHQKARTAARDRDTGNEIWVSAANQPGTYFFGYSYYTCPDRSKLILMACANGLHAISSENGKDVWWLRQRSTGGVTPCVDQANGWIYYQCDGKLLKVRAEDGVALKTVAVSKPNRCISWNTVLVNDAHGSFVATYWIGPNDSNEWGSGIRVYDKNLDLAWEKTGRPAGKKATLTYAEGRLVTGSGNGWGAKYTGDQWKYITAYAVADGRTLWKCDLSRFDYTCILNVPYHGGFFYAETQDLQDRKSKLFRIRSSDGELAEVLDYGRAITSCAPCIIARGQLFSGDLWQDRVVVTKLATNGRTDWPGPFGDPQTNQNAAPPDLGAQTAPMREIRFSEVAKPAEVDGTRIVRKPAALSIPNNTKYLAPVLGCLDTLIGEGTDRYGSEHSPMFCSVLDLKTRRMPDKAPQLLPGQRAADRAFPGGNLQHDLHTLLVMYHVSRLTGDRRYQQAADAYLEFFLRRCAAAGNGLFPYGEHAFWDFTKEKIGGLPIHEDLGQVPAEFLDHLWAIQPKAVEKHIRGLIGHFLEGPKWVWNRHASILDDKRPKAPAPFPRHGGFYLYQWAYLYTKTHDPQLLDWARKTAVVHDHTLHSMLSLGLSMLQANQLLGAEKLPEFDSAGRKFLQPFVEDKSNDIARGFISLFTMYEWLAQGHSTRPKDYRPNPSRTYGFWDLLYTGSGGYGFLGAENLAIRCLCAHRLTGSRSHLEYARAVCQFYLEHPRPEIAGITPGKLAGQMALALDLYDLTREEKYRRFARDTAAFGLQALSSQGVVRAATGADYYEAANGVGLLLIELVRLHLLETGSDYPLPRSYNDT